MNNKLKLFIDIPESFEDKALLISKTFEYVDSRPTKYLKDYHIIYRQDKPSSIYIEKLIKDWDLDAKGYLPDDNSNKAKYKCIQQLAQDADEALIFHDYSLGDMGSKITIDVCDRQFGLYYKVYRIDFDKFI